MTSASELENGTFGVKTNPEDVIREGGKRSKIAQECLECAAFCSGFSLFFIPAAGFLTKKAERFLKRALLFLKKAQRFFQGLERRKSPVYSICLSDSVLSATQKAAVFPPEMAFGENPSKNGEGICQHF